MFALKIYFGVFSFPSSGIFKLLNKNNAQLLYAIKFWKYMGWKWRRRRV